MAPRLPHHNPRIQQRLIRPPPRGLDTHNPLARRRDARILRGVPGQQPRHAAARVRECGVAAGGRCCGGPGRGVVGSEEAAAALGLLVCR